MTEAIRLQPGPDGVRNVTYVNWGGNVGATEDDAIHCM